MKKLLVTAILFFALGTNITFAQNFNKGLDAYVAGEYTVAIKEWKPLAERGNAAAQYLLGVIYQKGMGVLQDYAEAVKWYRLSAEQSSPEAQSNLGHIYQMGEGVPQDYSKALKWHRLAAEQNYAASQVSLGVLYQYGNGVIKDNVTAHMWYNIASANGFEAAGIWRDEIAKNITTSDISKATAMARECMASDYKKCGY
jgi:uncharacterized protein